MELVGSFGSGSLSAQEWKPSDWPVLKHYDKEHLFQIALPLGGIGTGTVSLGGRGELRDWEIMNVPGKKYSTVTTGNNAPFFSIYVKSQDNIPVRLCWKVLFTAMNICTMKVVRLTITAFPVLPRPLSMGLTRSGK